MVFYSILEVDVPVLILHAEDDGIVPFKLGKKVCSILFFLVLNNIPKTFKSIKNTFLFVENHFK